MKISYMLLNQNGVDSEIPKGQAWKWILHIEDKIEIYLIVVNLKKKIADNKRGCPIFCVNGVKGH